MMYHISLITLQAVLFTSFTVHVKLNDDLKSSPKLRGQRSFSDHFLSASVYKYFEFSISLMFFKPFDQKFNQTSHKASRGEGNYTFVKIDGHSFRKGRNIKNCF